MSLEAVLDTLGMKSAFDPATADFSGMTSEERLHVSHVLHQAMVAVDEEGTEAGAATAVIMGVTGAVPLRHPRRGDEHAAVHRPRDRPSRIGPGRAGQARGRVRFGTHPRVEAV